MKIYKHTSPSGKSYIGKTIRDVKTRLNEHIKQAEEGSIYTFHVAIRKYGIENFTSIILEDSILEEELNEREKYWIKYYDTYKNGYNMSEGGDGGDTISNHPNRDEICKKISIANSGKGNGFYGKTHTEENKRKWSEQMKGNSFGKDYKHTAEAKEKISHKSKLAMNNPAIRNKISETLSNKIKYIITDKENSEEIIYGSKKFWLRLKELDFCSPASKLSKQIINVGIINIPWKNGYNKKQLERMNGWKIQKIQMENNLG